jgi:hypothetical protein
MNDKIKKKSALKPWMIRMNADASLQVIVNDFDYHFDGYQCRHSINYFGTYDTKEEAASVADLMLQFGNWRYASGAQAQRDKVRTLLWELGFPVENL